jgi:hypothetical protein
MKIECEEGTKATINGTNYIVSGNMTISGNGIFINGVKQEQNIEKGITVNVVIHGNAEDVSTVSGNITINGDANDVESVSGSIGVAGSAQNVETVSGSVKANSILGKIKTVSGRIGKDFM